MPDNARAMLRTVAVAGAGPVALGAAIALRRALPRSAVVLIAAPDDPAALADQAPTTVPFSNGFHARLGLTDADLVQRAGASHRLAVALHGWPGADGGVLHPYGAAPPDGLDPARHPAVAGELAAAGRFALPSDDRASPLSDLDFALRFHPGAYRRVLADLARRCGVTLHPGMLRGALPDGTGGVAQLVLDDGTALAADLFVDCTGPAAHIASVLPNSVWDSWTDWLGCDRLLVGASPAPPALAVTDTLTARPLGWHAAVHGRDGVHQVFAAHSAVGTLDEQARDAGFVPGAVLTIAAGRRRALWQANVLTLGDSAVRIEPLHWQNLALAQALTALFLDHVPGQTPDPLEQAEFNRRAGALADRARDFAALHYHPAAMLPGPFWRRAAGLEVPAALARTMAEYRRRGRLPVYDDDPLPADAWRFALAATGHRQGAAARWMAVPAAARAALAASHQARTADAVRCAVPYPAWLGRYLDSAA